MPDSAAALTSVERMFLYEFAVWIYRAIAVYNRLRPSNSIVLCRHIGNMGGGRTRLSGTFLDVVLSLIWWERENADFVTLVLRQQHSGYNKPDWTRTVARRTPTVNRKRVPVYINPINRKRRIDFDEELLVIFFSILHSVGNRYGFPVDSHPGFTLLTEQQFTHYEEGFGLLRLKQIKYRYFSDKALSLWELCYAFFDKAHEIRINAERREYLLAKNFNIVFEAMIDELIGDKDIPEGLKEQRDGKRVDHLYTWQGLIEADDRPAYYIGDSKYYKLSTSIGRESVYKQQTYARNVTQWNLDIFLDPEAQPKPEVKLRDDVTEGYNVIPNFFISARLDERLSYDDTTRPAADNRCFFSRQFENRLFDRDTLLVFHYNVNFLYVLSLYARGNEVCKARWRERVRNRFRAEIQQQLAARYDFYAIRPRPNVDGKRYIREHLDDVLGKVFSPFASPDTYSLALDRGETFTADNEALLARLRQSFFVARCEIGSDPESVLPKRNE